MEMYLTADDKAWVYADGKYLGRDNGRWNQAKKYTLPLGTTLLAVYVKNSGGGPTGLLAKLNNGLKTDSKWKVRDIFIAVCINKKGGRGGGRAYVK